MAKAKKNTKLQEQESYKVKPMAILLVAVILCIAVTLILLFVRPLTNDRTDQSINPRAIDCMPPMSASETECLDSGECYCATY